MFRCRGLILVAISLVLQLAEPSSAVAASRNAPLSLTLSYIPALAAADRFLQAWQSGDVGNGMALLTSHSRENATTDVLEKFFAGSGISAYEIGRGKLVKHGRYEFPIALVSADEKRSHLRRRFSSIVVVDTGHDDWAVDKLP